MKKNLLLLAVMCVSILLSGQIGLRLGLRFGKAKLFK